jgi:hypothetical protein
MDDHEEVAAPIISQHQYELLKLKLQAALQEAQVLEAEKISLQTSTKIEIFHLENELNLANKREKLLKSQLEKARDEGARIIMSLPVNFFVPTAIKSHSVKKITLSLDKVLHDPTVTTNPKRIEWLKNDFLLFFGDFMKSGDFSCFNLRGKNTKTDAFCFQDCYWSQQSSSNLLNGQARHFFSLEPFSLSLLQTTFNDDDESEEPLEMKMNFKSVFLSLYFEYLMKKHQNIEKSQSLFNQFLELVLVYWKEHEVISFNIEGIISSSEYQFMKWIGRLIFGKSFSDYSSLISGDSTSASLSRQTSSKKKQSHLTLDNDFYDRQQLDYFIRVFGALEVCGMLIFFLLRTNIILILISIFSFRNTSPKVLKENNIISH